MIPNKIGRNDPCWCGSGKKHKKCHLNRELQEKVNPWDVAKAFKEAFAAQTCSSPASFHEKCSAKIVNAHTVPKSASLKSIARNGHVYGPKYSFEHFLQSDKRFAPTLIGINKASTFTGFCTIHDNDIFSPLEDEEFSNEPQQCFLLAYRAFARECYTKSATANLGTMRSKLDRGKSLDAQMNIQMINCMSDIGTNATQDDNLRHKECYDICLESSDFDQVRALSFEFDAPPPVMASGAIFPDYDFDGNLIQDLMEFRQTPDLLTITSFFDGKFGYIVFAWLESCHISAEKIVLSLLQKPRADIPILLAQYLFSNLENCYSAPDWWEGLDNHTQETIIKLQRDNVSMQSEPNADGFCTRFLDIDFPNLTNITPVNWTPNIKLQN